MPVRYSLKDTIVAIATPPGVGALGILRLSGEEAFTVAPKVLRNPGGGPYSVEELPSHTVHYGYLMTRDGERIDEVLFSLFKAPRSYTREDMVEITCHGGPVALRRGLEALIEAGARVAEPGEFTLRAFIHGRLDLVQAEAVLDLIEARTEGGAKAALDQLGGDLSCRIRDMVRALRSVLVQLEASIDFSEETGGGRDGAGVAGVVEDVLDGIDALLATFQDGRIQREGVATALVGLPNVGKSSLLNALLGEERAIVTSVPGTTRDVVEDQARFGGTLFRFMDTAGMGKPNNLVDEKGMERTRRCLEDADLVLVVLDVSRSLMEEDLSLIQSAGPKGIGVLNKVDLPRAWSWEDLRGRLGEVPFFEVSAKRGDGLEGLKKGMAEIVARRQRTWGDRPLLTNARHFQALVMAKEALEGFMKAWEEGLTDEFLAEDIREALKALGEVTGETTAEDTLEAIFSRFCIGK